MHDYNIIDKEPHFKIDATTRKITNELASDIAIVQFDHNSEVFTFELPRHIENHDMTECNTVEIHYKNTDASTLSETLGVYTVTDLQPHPEDETRAVCTWLISQNATQKVGKLDFLVRFSRVDEDGVIKYVWNTAIFTGIMVSEGLMNTEEVLEPYIDILEQWKAELAGERTVDGGEIFNDYDSNQAIGEHSHSEGTSNYAGGKAFKIKNLIQNAEPNLAALYLDSVEGLEIGDVYSCRMGDNYDLCGTIASIHGEADPAVLVTGFPTNTIALTAASIFYIPAKPEVGTQNIGTGAHAEGWKNIARNDGSHAEGYNNMSAGRWSHTEGKDNVAGYAAHAEGWNNQSLGEVSHTEGRENIASGATSHAEGGGTKARGDRSHTEGSKTETGEVAFAAHAEGRETQANGDWSHSEGYGSEARGIGSHAEGYYTLAREEYTHTEGYDTKAEAKYVHVEGYSCKAYGEKAHVEGEKNDAGGKASHTEGGNNVNNGEYAHVEGLGNTLHGVDSYHPTRGLCTHVQGKYAEYDLDGKYVHIVGWGEDKDHRNNIHTIDREGNAWFEGDVEADAIILRGTDNRKYRLTVNAGSIGITLA